MMEIIEFKNLPDTTTPVNSTNLNQLQKNVEDAINGVVESGSNNNGNYIKYADGTLICRGIANITITTNTWGSIHACDWTGTISFPMTFTEKPTVNAVATNFSGAITKVLATTNAITAISLLRGSEGTSITYDIDYIAIGKWK